MLILRLALRNLFGTGLRLWINILVLTFSIGIIIFARAVYTGLTNQVLESLIRTEVGSGQIISKGFDPVDTLTYEDSHRKLPKSIKSLVNSSRVTPVLFCTGTLYTKSRVMQINFRGIDTNQKVLDFSTDKIKGDKGHKRILVGLRMLKSLGLKKGDYVTIKWRDSNGAYDADDFQIAQLFDKNNPRIDENVIWIDINVLQKMFNLKDMSSIVIFKSMSDFNSYSLDENSDWEKKSQKELTKWIVELINSDQQWWYFIYMLLIFLCCIGIFNSQILEIFKRRREIGTLMALGMRKNQIVALFMLEGILITLMGIIGVLIIGTPIFYWTTLVGISLSHAQGMGMPIPERLIPHYSVEVITFALSLIMVATVIVSWLPTRKITSLNPSVALTGRLS